MDRVSTGVTIGKEVQVEFEPKLGQTDFTNVKHVPVVSCVLVHDGKLLLIQRSQKMRFYPGYWGGVSGFLDDDQGVIGKAKYEIMEEAGIEEKDIAKISEGLAIQQKETSYQKIWEIHPVRVEVSPDQIRLDWEGEDYIWVDPQDVKSYNLLPGFEKVIGSLFPESGVGVS